MDKFFGLVDEVESHNESRQSYLELEKFWVEKCGWIWLCTNVYMGVNINNGCKLFCYGVKRDHCKKFIGSVNELDSQNKSWQSDLALEKF